MSGYNGEPEKMVSTWAPENTNRFEYGPKMRRLANSLIQQVIEPEERSQAIVRLCETAAVSDSIECRTTLAQIAGIPFSEVGIYKYAVGKTIDDQELDLLQRVIELSLDAFDADDFDKYNLLTASIGFYPYSPQDLIVK